MIRPEVLSLSKFEQLLSERLSSASQSELKNIIRNMAQKVAPENRESFLQSLEGDLGPISEEEIDTDSLIAKIESTIEQMKNESTNIDWDADYMHGDDVQGLGPFEDFIEPLSKIANEIDQIFQQGHEKAAGACYKALFKAFDVTNEFSHHVSPSDLGGQIASEERRAKYLRTIITTEHSKCVASNLYEAFLWLSEDWGPKPTLKQVIDVSSNPIDLKNFLPDWIRFLEGKGTDAARCLRREAVVLISGANGLEAIAKKEGLSEPRWHLDWLKALAEVGKWEDIKTASKFCFENVPTSHPLIWEIAKLVMEAARKQGDDELLLDACWRGFSAKPSFEGLILLFESTSESKRDNLLSDAAKVIKERKYESKKKHDLDEFKKSAEDRWEYNSNLDHTHFDPNLLLHAHLLSGDVESAFRLAKKQKELGWSYENPQGFFVAYVFGRTAPKALQEKPAINDFWHWALDHSVGRNFSETANLKDRYGWAYKDLYLGIDPPDPQILEWCLSQSEKRIVAIVSNTHRGAYERAATLTMACSQTLEASGRTLLAKGFVARIRSRFSRYPAFQREFGAKTDEP